MIGSILDCMASIAKLDEYLSHALDLLLHPFYTPAPAMFTHLATRKWQSLRISFSSSRALFVWATLHLHTVSCSLVWDGRATYLGTPCLGDSLGLRMLWKILYAVAHLLWLFKGNPTPRKCFGFVESRTKDWCHITSSLQLKRVFLLSLEEDSPWKWAPHTMKASSLQLLWSPSCILWAQLQTTLDVVLPTNDWTL